MAKHPSLSLVGFRHFALLAPLTLVLACGGTSGEQGSDSGTNPPPGGDASGAVDAGGPGPGVDGGGPSTPDGGSGKNDGGNGGQPDGGNPGSPEAGPSADGGDAGPWVTDPASLVNTLFGTTAGGNTFPGPDVPFGMMQWSPDTSPTRNDGSGYDYTDGNLIGFSLTHISGPGCSALGDIPMLPMVGALPSGDPTTHTETITHGTSEIGQAGYYSVQSGTGAQTVTTELTATKHSAMARFTFPATTSADLLIKFLDSQNGGNTNSDVTFLSQYELQGSTTEPFNFCGSQTPYTVYFDMIFDQPFTHQTVAASGGNPNVVFLTFNTMTTQVVQAKVAISWVSETKAQANWTAENTNWNFDAVKASAHAAWNDVLNTIQIVGGSLSSQQLFYTSLYHTLLHPNVFSDVDGQYLGFDNQTHTVLAPYKDQYANYSGWDIYHSQVQLSALMAPQQMSDSAESMVVDAEQNIHTGQLPKWALGNAETYVMVGDPADGILAGYYAFGATAFDTKTAFKYMSDEATRLTSATYTNWIRPGLNYYLQNGYLPDNGTYGNANYYGSVSTTLEYTEADFAISQFAAALGNTSAASSFLLSSQNWQNLYDPTSGLFNPRLLDGTFVSGINLSSNEGMVEGNASQYRWIVPFNRLSQLTAMGGPSAVNPMLATFFTNLNDPSGTDAFFANEFQLGTQYWDSFTGQPARTQDVVNRLRTQVFTAAPAFFNNNDDLGAESSMLAWSMLGLYPDYPGSGILTLNGPEFEQELIHLPSGNTIAINAPGVTAATPYVQSLDVNGQPSTALWLPATFVQTGGTLDFTMGSGASAWGTGAADAPPSFGVENTAAIGVLQPSVTNGPFVVPVGGTATVGVGAQSTRTDVSQTVSWETTADAGVPLSPASGSVSLAAGGANTATVNITLPATVGTYTVPFAFTSSLGVPCPTQSLALYVTNPAPVLPYFNNAGTSADGQGGGNFDGVGYSYSATALSQATPSITPGATFVVGSTTFKWPNVVAGQPDNIIANGQTMQVFEPVAKSTISLLGSGTNAAATGGAAGNLIVNYVGGTTGTIAIGFTDWTMGGGGGTPQANNSIAITTAYRDQGGSQNTVKTYVFAVSYGLMNLPVQSITLPAIGASGTIHLFDIELN